MAKDEMHADSMSGAKPGASTQAYLDIKEIKEDTVIMKDGSLRVVMAVSSLNFSLKSADEQGALIAAYQGFLNALDFPIQILLQSRKLDIHGYLDKLRLIMQQQTNELLRIQTQEYIEYIAKLIEFASIMNKTFYIIVPLSTAGQKTGFFSKLTNLFNPAREITLHQTEFERNKEELSKRVLQVQSGLAGMGLKTIPLKTEELIELIYNSYNLDTATPIKIQSVDELNLADVEQK